MLLRLIAMLVTTTLALATAAAPPVAEKRPFVVKSPQGERLDEYHWMRDDDPKAKRAEVIDHLKAENAYFAAQFAPLQPLQDQLVAEMRSRIKEDDSTAPVYREGYWTWQRYDTGAEYPRLLRRRGTPEAPDAAAPEELLLDQPARAQGQPYYGVGGTAVSPDGKLLAWAENTTGKRSYTLRIKEIAGDRLLPVAVDGILEPLAWSADSRTLFYIRQDPQTLQSGPVWRHRIGSDPAADVKVFEEADKTLFVDLRASASRRFVLIDVGGFDTTETLVIPADAPDTAPRVALARKPQVRSYADHHAGRWVIRTNQGAVNFKLVEAPEAAPDDRRRWRTLVAHRTSIALENFALFDRGVAFTERANGDPRVRLLQGKRFTTIAEAPATVVTLGANPDPKAAHLRYDVTNLTTPPQNWDHHFESGRKILRKQREVPNFDARLYATARVWARAADGARIPVSLAWRRDRAAQDGRAPLVLTGYGSYGSSYDPEFRSSRMSWLDRGFVFAIAHVRGGAELGEPWYEAGRLMNKKNTFTDFVAATEHLVKARWAASDRVFATGGSAGGLLMGVVANDAGMKYRGIALHVPFVDVVSTMLDETIPLTANEWTQWGDPRQPEAYRYMLSYSPYDQLKAQPYPAMLVTTGLWDSQVGYFEPAKYVARLRARKTNDTPLLFHTELGAGHGGRSGRFEFLKELAREMAFFIDLAGPPTPAAAPAAPRSP
jgi:oligopeptidase B